MTWYRFWKKSGPMGGLDETYRYYDEKPSKDMLETDCGSWAEAMPGGHNTHYSYGFGPINAPPIDWLLKKLQSSRNLRNRVATDINFYEREVERVSLEAHIVKEEGKP
jgi:hypothetical protein